MSRAVSPHEKKFAQQLGSGRFGVTSEQIKKARMSKRPVVNKSLKDRLMESAGRASRVPGQPLRRGR